VQSFACRDGSVRPSVTSYRAYQKFIPSTILHAPSLLEGSSTSSNTDKQWPEAGVEGTQGQQQGRMMHVLSREKWTKSLTAQWDVQLKATMIFFTYLYSVFLLSSVDPEAPTKNSPGGSVVLTKQQTINAIEFFKKKN
jgi:hypothetical protein